jgi:hypothetical protein
MEWTKDYIYWKLNAEIYWTQFIDTYFEFEIGRNYNKIREPFERQYFLYFQLYCDPNDYNEFSLLELRRNP